MGLVPALERAVTERVVGAATAVNMGAPEGPGRSFWDRPIGRVFRAPSYMRKVAVMLP
jgi:hypothetical protein